MSTVDIEAQHAPAEMDGYDSGVKWTDNGEKQHIDGGAGERLKRTRSRVAEKPNVVPVRKDTAQSEDAREKRVRGPALDTSTSWARCAEELWKHEKDVIQDLKEGIDTLLLFAGLFSAVVTAFNVEFYKTLQPQPTDSTAQILMHISAQLNSFTVNSGSINSTILGYPVRYPESVSQLDIATNTLWFSALVISLAAASIGITIKQWLNNHVAGVPSNPRQSAIAWYLRHTGFDQWHVEDIVNLMPILLQLSLMLFLIGLVLQFWKTSAVVAGMVLGQMVILMAFAFGTAITPSLNPHSPYKSPMSRAFYRLFRVWRGNYGMSVRRLKRTFAKWRVHWSSTMPPIVRQYTSDFRPIENLPLWEDREDLELTGLVPNIEPVVVLDAAFKTLKGAFLDRVLQPFLRLAPFEIALDIFEHYCNKEDVSSTPTIGYMAVDILSNLHSKEVSIFDRNRPASRSGKIFPTPLSGERVRIIKFLQIRLSNMPSGERSLYDRLVDYYRTLAVSSEHRLHLLQLLTYNMKNFCYGEELAEECFYFGRTAVEMLSEDLKPHVFSGSDSQSPSQDILDCLRRLLQLTPANDTRLYISLIDLLGAVDLPTSETTPSSMRRVMECVFKSSTSILASCEGIPTLLSLFTQLRERNRADETILLVNVARCILRHLWRCSGHELRVLRSAVLDKMPTSQLQTVMDTCTDVKQRTPDQSGKVGTRMGVGLSGEEDSEATLDAIVYGIHRLLLLPEGMAISLNRERDPEQWALECAYEAQRTVLGTCAGHAGFDTQK